MRSDMKPPSHDKLKAGATPLSQRQLRTGEMIRRSLDEVLRSGELYHAGFEDYLLSVTQVKMAPDLKIAKVYISSLRHSTPQKEILAALQQEKYRIRMALARRVILRCVPDLRFYWDDTLEYAHRIEELLHSVAVKHPPQNNEEA